MEIPAAAARLPIGDEEVSGLPVCRTVLNALPLREPLSDDQKQKVQTILQQYGEKQRQVREDLLKQLKTTLDAEQYGKVEASIKQPPPPNRRQ